jgi:hypothetical protein
MNRTINLLVKQLVLAWIAASLFTVSNFTNVHAGLIVNGDFELRNVGFSSDYAFTEGVQPFPGLGGGQYNIVHNPSPFHFAAADYRDHTTGSGNMMMVNADWNLQNLIVWSQTATVEKNTIYEFSTWISTWAMAGDLNVSRLEVKVNGVSIGKHTAPAVGESGNISQHPGSQRIIDQQRFKFMKSEGKLVFQVAVTTLL